MFALRRAANPLATTPLFLNSRFLSQRYGLGVSRTCYTKSDNLSDASGNEQHGTTSSCHKQVVPGFFYHRNCFITRGLCSQVGAKSSDADENLEGEFSELDSRTSPTVEGTTVGPENDEEVVSSSELSDDGAEEDFVEDQN
ncbi:hypothetical protein MKX03_008981 [Papaver bracteatum]|nr:hypothetical protein MKX03_008981 [Papaver bracteatum]